LCEEDSFGREFEVECTVLGGAHFGDNAVARFEEGSKLFPEVVLFERA
jgi:hypothetical protein